MSYSRAFVVGSSVFIAALAMAASASAQGAHERSSVNSNEVQANGQSGFQSPPAISGDGRYVAFDSLGNNFLIDTNNAFDIFVRDRVDGKTVRVSVDSAGNEANSSSFHPSISKDGRFVAFHSFASNLVANDTNGSPDVFVHDRDPDANGIYDEGNGVTTLVSVDSSGAQGDDWSLEPSISDDGSLVAFYSLADNFSLGDTNLRFDVFVHDMTTGATDCVSLNLFGFASDGDSFDPDISGDGKVVAFTSYASSLVANDTNNSADIFVYDRPTFTMTRASVDSTGAEHVGDSLGPASLSVDGGVVAFYSYATFDPIDFNRSTDTYLRDLVAGTTEFVSVNSSQLQGNGPSYAASVSADGLTVAFWSDASNLVAGDTNLDSDVFLRDRTLATTIPISWSCTFNNGNAPSYSPALSSDGMWVAFTTDSTNLIFGDGNNVPDVMLDDRAMGELEASWSNYDVGFAGTNGIPTITPNVDPEFGANLVITTTNSSGVPTIGFLLVGLDPDSKPTPLGGTLLVDFLFVVPLAFSPTDASWVVDVPVDDSLCGAVGYLQTVLQDQGAQFGWAFTDGLKLVVGH